MTIRVISHKILLFYQKEGRALPDSAAVFIIAQIIGFVGLSLNLLSFQQRDQKKLIMIQFFGATVFAVHFGLLGAVSGCILNVVGILRAFVYYNKNKKWASHGVWLYIFIFLYFVCYALSFLVFSTEPTLKNFILELLPVIGMTSLNIGYTMKKASHVRITGLICSPSWLVYNAFRQSWPGVLTEVLSIVSIIVGMIRLDRKTSAQEPVSEDEAKWSP